MKSIILNPLFPGADWPIPFNPENTISHKKQCLLELRSSSWQPSTRSMGGSSCMEIRYTTLAAMVSCTAAGYSDRFGVRSSYDGCTFEAHSSATSIRRWILNALGMNNCRCSREVDGTYILDNTETVHSGALLSSTLYSFLKRWP